MSIVYMVPCFSHPVGGVKVMYQHAQALHEAGIAAEIHHPENPDFRCDWFEHQAPMRRSTVFQPSSDFVVLPEIWAISFGSQLRDAGIRYGIFVQNGHLLNASQSYSFDAELQAAYLHAECLLSISECATELIRLAFPKVEPQRILPQLPCLGSQFTPRPKKKVITFMPRKLPIHAKLFAFFMAQYLPRDWSIMPIMEKSEQEVVDMLASSSIFLSFSDLEGLGLPPLEAAAAGNVVVGYTGEAGKAYFVPPVFHGIACGDIAAFVHATRVMIAEVDAGLLRSAQFEAGVRTVKNFYSEANQHAHLMAFAHRVLGE